MRTARFVILWSLLIVAGWVIVGGAIGLVAAFALEVFGPTATLLATAVLCVVAIVLGAIPRKDTRP